MKATGIVRRIDDLGRIVIPKEIRRTLRIRETDPMEIYTDIDGQIVLKKYSPMGDITAMAEEYVKTLAENTGMTAAITDRDHVIAAAGNGWREYEQKTISRELEEQISDRKNICAAEQKEFIRIIEGDKMEYASQVVWTITCAGDAVGAVIILEKEGGRKFTDTEPKLAQAAAGFLGRQMEQ